MAGKSEEEVWDFVDKNIYYVAEHLKDEASFCLLDGSAQKFLIDDEQPPYIRAVGVATYHLLSKLRSIDPFKVEEICADILKGFGADAYSTQKTADGGIDFVAANMSIVPEGYAYQSGVGRRLWVRPRGIKMETRFQKGKCGSLSVPDSSANMFSKPRVKLLPLRP